MLKQKSFSGNQVKGILYLVPTPIGNLEDMTFRSVKILKEVALIASEDTRNTQKLLNHYEISTSQKSLHEHNYRERIPQLLELLNAGQSIAQVSDAGMPSISDPGHELVKACIQAEINVVALPGPTAGVTALIASGLNPQPFTFYGFLPRKKKEQVAFLQPLVQDLQTSIFYESPYRMKNTVTVMQEVFGGSRQAVICRELTKIHEEYLRGSLAELTDYLAENELKGECCLLVAGFSEADDVTVDSEEIEAVDLKAQVETLVQQGTSPKVAIKEIAKKHNLKKQAVYQAYHEL
ncbi:16S rRNA (cytidine1402-2'-O)-methyltransferase [Enterococcus sp. PF1-24]|uniref:16S rRNA (cytidine(1402)-2'-O)-methyltransferase n=1 Tax=unclassified Enterococcus TaxID=2608891 RepID=UPI002475E02E|nr:MULTISPECIES: 16S rRNA (cytidine(1402)-2'-O)-methyltransferase [unclassified Enterococcus]MDH6364786.1 16S rRNA (cytidine1402-2'-O)-methyltransferase [Enterococcus sp. PFB1-1]MDH6401869.1 16S rRNA (cytidine1402-2'-O)-methyltransferase [Enterococcus sp. PF1-24]